MKTRTASSLFLALTITAVLALAARNVSAQASATSAAQTTPVQLSYGVSQIIQLSQANVSEGTIVSYIQNSGNSYGLDANQIVYLKQQGVSDTVINTMLTQPRAGQAATPPPAYAAASDTATATVVASPAVTYVQPAPAAVPASTVYVVPDTQTYNYYAYAYRPYYSGYYSPYYRPSYYYSGCYPSVSFSFGFGGSHWGGHARGGMRGNWHR